jgi:glycerol-3-phosphate dehydrogenase
MAIDAIDRAVQVASLPVRPSPTAALKLHGCCAPDAALTDASAVYGSDAAGVTALCDERPERRQPLHPSLPYRAGEVIWAARHEAARSVEDVLARRTRALFLDARACIEAAPLAASLLAAELGRGTTWQELQVAEFRTLAEGYLPVL